MQLSNSTMRSEQPYEYVREHFTCSEIAELAGISRQAVAKTKNIESFSIGQVSLGGRPLKKYHPDVLGLFGIEHTDCKIVRIRKQRKHKDIPLKVDQRHEDIFVDLARRIYLESGIKNFIRNACQNAAMQLWNADYEYYSTVFAKGGWQEMAEYFYKRRITRNDTKNDFVGYAYRYPSWQVQWAAKWKKKDEALIRLPASNYNWISIAEDAKIIGEGKGAATIWVLDDHSGDSFVRDDERKGYKGSLPKGLFMMDGLTGFMLDYIPGEVNSATVATMIIRNVLRYGLPYAIVLENSRVMKNARVDGAIESLYDDDAIGLYREDSGGWFHTFFEKATSPIVRNLPNIPRFSFKARLERMFQDVKQFDAFNFPITYQGGGTDAVQNRISTVPSLPPKSYTVANHTATLKGYLGNEYLTKERVKMFQGFSKRTGLAPTIANAWAYYGGLTNPGTGTAIDSSKFAVCLYYLSLLEIDTPVLSRRSKAGAGHVGCVVDHRKFNFADAKIAMYEGKTIDIIFIPDTLGDTYTSGDYAALFHVKGGIPYFINICRDSTIDTLALMKEKRKEIRDVRKAVKDATIVPFRDFRELEQNSTVVKQLEATNPPTQTEFKLASSVPAKAVEISSVELEPDAEQTDEILEFMYL
jgi:hypothetical protein